MSRQTLDPRDGGAAVDVAPGATVIVEGQILSFGSDKRIARVHAFPRGAPVVSGPQLGTVRSDVGGIVVCDGDVLVNWRAEDEDALGEWNGGIGYRPWALVLAAEHALGQEQRGGISLERAYELAGRMMHAWTAPGA